MGLTIENYKEESLVVEDYENQPTKGAVINNKTAAQLAAGQTVLSSGSPEQYERIKQDLLDPESRTKFILDQENLRRSIFEDSRESLVNVLSDPNVDDQTKVDVARTADEGFGLDIKTPSLDILAEESLVAESDEHESARSAESRNLLLESVNRVNSHKREMTKLINGLNLDVGGVNSLVDTAELMAPFAEWIHYDRLLATVKGENSTNLLGEQKRELFEYMKGRPLEERALMAESLINLIQNSDTIILPDGNDLETLESLQNMLVENDYSDFERYFDNVTSLLDMVGVAGLVRNALKAPKTASKVSKLQKEANEFVSKGSPTDPKLKRDAEEFVPKDLETDSDLQKEADKFVRDPDPTADTVFRKAKKEAVRTEVIPTSPSQVVKDSNPKIAKDMHRMVDEDVTDNSAEALYGASRSEALGKDLLPEIELVPGRMPNKVEMTAGKNLEPDHIKKLRNKDGNTILSPREVGLIREKISAGLKEIEGMVMHPSSMIMRVNPDETVTWTARYSPIDSGFSSPQDAIDAAQVAFRNYGLSPEDLKILVRRGDEWVDSVKSDLDAEFALKKAGADGFDSVDYAIGISYDYQFSPKDVNLIANELDNLSTAPGVVSKIVQGLDSATGHVSARLGQGSILQNLLDSASTIHPRIVNAASVAVDRAFGIKAKYVEEFEEFTKNYNSLHKNRKAMMSDYIHQANLEGISLDVSDLLARGFNDDEIEMLKQWRKANDTMWHGANDDLRKSMDAKGIKVFTNVNADTTLFGRPASRVSIKSGDFYDPSSDSVVRKSPDELDDLYNSNGEIFILEEPIEVNGKYVDRVISSNTPAGGFVRPLRKDEVILSYREGYYPVMYDANHFVYKNITDSDGKSHKKVFAAAKTRKEVDTILKGIQKSENLSDSQLQDLYGHRPDRRIESTNNSLFDEGVWNVSSNSGLSSQRLRGQRLQEAGADLEGLGKAHLKDPLDAVATQVQHLSQRIAMRNYLDTAKNRWMAQYSDFLSLKLNDKTRKIEMPKNVSDIVGKPNTPSKMVEDAKTNFNYISSLENGYINGMDKAYRGTMRYVAQKLGEMGWGVGEKAAFKALNTSPAQFVKTAAFKMFISGNPARQALIQRGQMLLVTVHNPSYSLSKMIPDLAGIDMVRAGLSKNPKYVKLWEEVRDSGLMEAVDAHTLIRDDLLKMADMGQGSKVVKALGAPLRFSQKIGFDSAEQDVLLSAWLSARDKALKAGKNLKSQRVKDEVLGEARAFTLNMNRSGEMPYSQNTLAVMTQFFSFQHKALLQPLTNRSLSVKQRATLLGYSTAIFGMEATVLGLALDYVFGKEPSELKDGFKNGLLDVALNEALTQLSGEAQNIDFGDFAPSEAYGMGNLFFSLLDTPISEALTGAPAGSLLFGANPRLNDAFRTGFKYFYPPSDYSDPELEVNYKDVLHASMSLFSGYSNTFKANYAYQSKQKMSGTGRITDEDVTTIEAAAAAFGFRTKEEESSRKLRELTYGNSKFTGDDVDQWYQELKRHLARRYTKTSDKDMAQRVLAEAWEVFGEDRPRVMSRIMRKIEKDAQVGDHKLVMGIIRNMGMKTEEDIWEMINTLPDSGQRDLLTNIMKQRKEDPDGS